jgi:hypothetical protein
VEKERDMYSDVCKEQFDSLRGELKSIRKIQTEDHAILTNGLRDSIKEIKEAMKADGPWVKVLFKVGVPLMRLGGGVLILYFLLRFAPPAFLENLFRMGLEHFA